MGSKRIDKIDWKNIEMDYNNGLTKKDIYIKYKTTERSFKKAQQMGFLNIKSRSQSETIKNYLLKNPNNHSWKNNNKFKSTPCEKVKEYLKVNNISFLEEFTPLENRNFSIDIAFPDKKIGIEINGNQHYNADGTLKPYYQERHNLIEADGWKLFEYHYSIAFDNDLLDKIVINLNEDYNLGNIDYSFYIKEIEKYYCIDCKCEVYHKSKRCKKCNNEFIKLNSKNIKPKKESSIKKEIATAENNYCICGCIIQKNSKTCVNCYKRHKKIIDRPSVEQILIDVKELGYCGTGRKYGVSDNCIRKWIKLVPPNGIEPLTI